MMRVPRRRSFGWTRTAWTRHEPETDFVEPIPPTPPAGIASRVQTSVPLERLSKQRSFVAKGIIKARLIEAGRLRQIANGRGLEPAPPEALDGGIEHLLVDKFAGASQGSISRRQQTAG